VFKRLRRHKFEFVEGDWPLPEILVERDSPMRDGPEPPLASYELLSRRIFLHAGERICSKKTDGVHLFSYRGHLLPLRIDELWIKMICHETNHWAHLRDLNEYETNFESSLETTADWGIIYD
jgi:hypothetical protein